MNIEFFKSTGQIGATSMEPILFRSVREMCLVWWEGAGGDVMDLALGFFLDISSYIGSARRRTYYVQTG